MEQLDHEDGLAVWGLTEGSELPAETAIEPLGIGGALRDLARLESRPMKHETGTSLGPAQCGGGTSRTVLVVTNDRDLAAIADRVVTLASPESRGGPGVHEVQDFNEGEGG